MPVYRVKPGQNIWDVSMHLYGSVEGLFDLLMSNPELGMSTDLEAGRELQYHEEYVVNETVVSGFAKEGVVPANGERHVYAKQPPGEMLMKFDLPPTAHKASITVGGDGVIDIDWGDNSVLERVTMSHANKALEHHFDNNDDNRTVSIYGNNDTVSFAHIDASCMGGMMYVIRPVVVGEYVNRGTSYSLSGLSLFDGTHTIDLRGSVISDLLPMADMDLQALDLRQAEFADQSVLDTYLAYVRDHYGTRRGCTVRLTTEPSAAGMAAIGTIIGEPEWNTPTKWVFDINGTIHTAQ